MKPGSPHRLKRLGALLLLVAVVPSALASPAGDQAAFERANETFAAGNYAAAATEFEALREAGTISAPLLYNLANAEAKAGRPGFAILRYEQALSLAPRDPDILANLRRTRIDANVEEPTRSRWQSFSRALTVDQWAWFSMATLWLGVLILLANGLRPARWSANPRLLASATVSLSLLVVITGGLCWARLSQLRNGVLTGPVPTLLVAPFDTADASVELSPGQIIEIERQHAEFVLVRTPTDQSGWIPRGQVHQILPEPTP